MSILRWKSLREIEKAGERLELPREESDNLAPFKGATRLLQFQVRYPVLGGARDTIKIQETRT